MGVIWIGKMIGITLFRYQSVTRNSDQAFDLLLKTMIEAVARAQSIALTGAQLAADRICIEAAESLLLPLWRLYKPGATRLLLAGRTSNHAVAAGRLEFFACPCPLAAQRLVAVSAEGGDALPIDFRIPGPVTL